MDSAKLILRMKKIVIYVLIKLIVLPLYGDTKLSLVKIICDAERLEGVEVVTGGYMHIPSESAYFPSLFTDEASYANLLHYNSVSLRMSETLKINGRITQDSTNRNIRTSVNRRYVEIRGVIPKNLLRSQDFLARAVIVNVHSITVLPTEYNRNREAEEKKEAEEMKEAVPKK